MADISNGASVTLVTTGLTLVLNSISWGGITREHADLSHLGTTGGKPMKPSNQHSMGELTLEGLLDPDDLGTIPINGAQENIQVDFPIPDGGITGARWEAQGSLGEFEFELEKDTEMTFSVTFTMSGDPTFTAST